MGRLEIPEAELVKIRTSPEMQADLAAIAAGLAADATARATVPGAEYGHGDVTVGTDRARAHVWPANGAAIHAENKTAPLLQIVGANGPRT
jgi:hypothetical protein